MSTPDHEVVVIGAGFGGIATGVELRKQGIEDFVLLEKHAGIGGTWWANTYPGIAVDIPAIYYSFSYEPFRSTRLFPPGHEVQAYAEHIVDKYGLRDRIRLGVTFTGAHWDDSTHLWHLDFADGSRMTCRYLIPALGILEQAKLPEIPGIESFAGKIVHSAQWDHDFDYAGKRIAVIGTGASGLQIIPEMAKIAGHLTVFQRTPIWLAPKPDIRIDWGLDQALKRPALRKAVRYTIATALDAVLVVGVRALSATPAAIPYVTKVAQGATRMWLRDKELADKLVPGYAPGCKRPSLSNEYFRTFKQKDRVSLVTEKMVEVTGNAVITADGTAHEIDVLVCATGFRVCEKGFSPGMPIHGMNGRELGDYWHENHYHAYEGVTVPGWPNLFLVCCGPNTIVPSSILTTAENNAILASRAIAAARRRGSTRVEVRQQPFDDFARMCVERAEGSMWMASPCAGSNTYYVNYQNELAIRPTTVLSQWWAARFLRTGDFSFHALPSTVLAAPAGSTVEADQVRAGVK
ncbi:flavin-containing monooxygenase [Nocardia sp. NPDC059240]|uniref:flavin-containing monooxygenase n=1 Tax=Nocardia sp. NPDC059240 TaxID=3346786 RepID=UPI0036A3A5B3